MTKISADDMKEIVDQIAASQKGVQEVEYAILESLQTYSKSINGKMDELVRLNLPCESEREAAEQVREEVLAMTAEIIRMVKDSLPRTNNGSE